MRGGGERVGVSECRRVGVSAQARNVSALRLDYPGIFPLRYLFPFVQTLFAWRKDRIESGARIQNGASFGRIFR